MKASIERRVTEVKHAARAGRISLHEQYEEARREASRKIVSQLTAAIADHQRSCADEDVEPTTADLRLWGLLDRLTVPHGTGTVTLSQMAESMRAS